MQAPTVQSRSTSAAGLPSATVAIIALYLATHAIWLVGPLVFDVEDIPAAARIVTFASLGLGLIGLFGLYRMQAWGWWLTLVLVIVNAFLTIPEIFSVEGIMRAGSIIAGIFLVAMLILLFRPGVRRPQA